MNFKEFQKECKYNICSGNCGKYDVKCSLPCAEYNYYKSNKKDLIMTQTQFFKIAISTQDIGEKTKSDYIEAFKNGFDLPLSDSLSNVIANNCRHEDKEDIIMDFEYSINMLKRSMEAIKNI